jgi:hypothetical protein
MELHKANKSYNELNMIEELANLQQHNVTGKEAKIS